MKKFISILLSTIILSSVFSVCLSVSAVTNLPEEIDRGTTTDGWTYSINKIKNENTEKYEYFAYVGEYVGTKSEATLPTKITVKTGTYNVTEISDWPISESTSLKKLIIPNSNTKLGKSKFSLCKSLEEVQIGSFVKSLSTSMFESDTKLKTVNFTKEFLAQKPFIGSRAFAKCTSLRNLVLPNGISGIADDALADAKNLETVSCGKDIEEFGIYNNVNLKKITLNCKKAKTRLYFNNFGWEGVNHNPETFNYKPVIVECYSGTEAEYYVNNVYPYWKGYEDDFKFVSLGQCEGTPYSHPTTAPPTTTAPYTVSVGEGDEWYLISSFNDWGNWNGSTVSDQTTKMTYNPANNTFEKSYTLSKGDYEFLVVANSSFNRHYFGLNGECSANQEFSIPTDNSKVKFVFDGIKVKMYINEQETTSTTVPPTTTSTTVPSTTITTSTTVPSTSVTTGTTVPDTSVSETASVPSTPTIPTVTAGTLNLEKTNDTLFVGKSREYKYTSSCNDPINYVKFVSSDNTIAQVNLNLNKDNTFTVVPLSKGTATITATLYDRDNREVTKSTFTVTVKQPVTKITIKANNKVVNNNVINIKKVNGRAKLNVSVAPANADDKRVTYKSSDTSVATVNSKGLITAKKIGYTTITIASNDGNVKTTVKVTVGDTATSIKIPSARFITTANSKAKLNPTIYYKKYSNNKLGKDAFWKSSNNKVAAVDSKGNVTAISNGWCYVQATAKDGSNKKSNNCLVVVGKNKVQSIKKTNYTQSKINVKKKHSITLKVEVKKINATYKNCNWSANNKLVKISNTKIYYSKDKKHCYVQAKVTAKKKGTCYVYCKTKDGSNKQLRYKIVIK